MNDPELFELCKEVYEKTGWETGEYVNQDSGRFKRDGDNVFFVDRDTVFYTSDYLLEKLPRRIDLIQLDEKRGWLASHVFEGFGTGELKLRPQGIAETPLKALLKLTKALAEAGELR